MFAASAAVIYAMHLEWRRTHGSSLPADEYSSGGWVFISGLRRFMVVRRTPEMRHS